MPCRLEQREQLDGAVGVDDLDLELGGASGGGLPLQLLPAVRSGGQVDRARPPIAGGLTGGGLESFEDPDAALDQVPGARGRARQGHQPRCVPRGAGGQALALEQDDVGPPELGQVVGHAAADDASADHDHACPIGQRLRHVVPPLARAVLRTPI